MMRSLALLIALAGCGLAQETRIASQAASAGNITVEADADAVRVTAAGIPAVRYRLQKPAQSPSNSPSAAYFHPLTTPAGTPVTDVGPDDHRHHRGIFTAWLEVRSAAGEGDFWGWGQHAPVENRRIVHRETGPVSVTEQTAVFSVVNEWQAGTTSLLEEHLQVTVTPAKDARVLDLTYRFSAKESVTLGRHAFSGFAVRLRKDAPLTAWDAAGAVKLPAPSHLEPDSDWPDRPWYAFEMALPEGKKASVAVLSHPENPPTRWHNVTGIALINPCIVAPAPVTIPADKPLTLRYRIVTTDAAVSGPLFGRLAKEFAVIPKPAAPAKQAGRP